MNYREVILFLLSLFQLSCQPLKDDPENFSIDLQTSPKNISLFGETIISTPLYERDIAISSSYDEIIYTLGDYKQNKRCLVILNKENGNWGKPEIMNISGAYQDIEPFYGRDGNRLYFASNRPIYNDSTRNDYNIWYSNKIEGVWSEPVPLDSTINTKADEFFPSLSNKGNLFFTSTRENGIGKEDIFMSEFVDGKFLLPEVLPTEINTPLYEFNAFISPNEDYIIFSSFGRNDGFGGGDLYISEKDTSGKWKKAKNMGEKINSDQLDFCPFIDSASRNLYFTSERIIKKNEKLKNIDDIYHSANSIENGLGNIYKIGFEELGLTQK